RALRLLVPFPPGGVTDILARLIAPKMGEGLKQNVLIDNRPGANGNIAVEAVAKSSPDGYTLLFGQVSNVAINPAIYSNLTFDTQRDLAPIALVASAPQLMVVSATSNYKSVADVLAAAKAKPGEVTFASSGNGSMAHMGLELMQLQAGIKFLHIPYKGAAPAVIDVIGGRGDGLLAATPAGAGHKAARQVQDHAAPGGGRPHDSG